MESIALQVLGEKVLNGIQDWYFETLSGKWDYVVYVVRRSYMLSQLMEKITGRYMSDVSQTVFLTDAAMFLACEDFVAYYREKGDFPQILLCDDLFIHGRNLNHLIETIEDRLIELLDDVDEDIVKNKLAKALTIHVYLKTDADSFLLNRYGAKLRFKRWGSSTFWHKLSSDISWLTIQADMANAAYIYSQHLKKTDVEKIMESEDLIKTQYQDTNQLTKVIFAQSMDNIKAISTLRFIKNQETDEYRAIPFVFFPALNESTTEVLHEYVIKRMKEHHMNYIRHINELYDLGKKRNYNELLTFIFSIAILNEMNNKYNIEIDENDKKREIEKLARNYYCSSLDDTKEFLQRLIDYPIFSSVSEVHNLFNELANPTDCVIEISDNYNFATDDEILRRLEDFFYAEGWSEEKQACIFFENPFYSNENKFERITQNCASTLNKFVEGLNFDDARRCIAYFLQMMDAGILSVSSNAGKHTKVHGLQQFIKTGEQALLIKPLRFYQYLPMLNKISEFCETDSRDELEIFVDFYNSGISKIPKRQAIEIVEFLNDLNLIEQKPMDWMGNYLNKISFDKNIEEEQLLNLMEERKGYKQRCEIFLKTC